MLTGLKQLFVGLKSYV